jgi:hypothetical protein
MQRTAPSDTLRAAVTLDARPVHRIARTANVPPTVLSRFMRGERGMTTRSFDRVAAAVGLELRPRRTA